MRALCILLLACSRPNAPVKTVEPIVVTGLVALGEQPAGIKVVLQGDYTNTTFTDDGGRYRFEGVPAGRYTVRASFGDFTREGEVSVVIAGEPGSSIDVPTLTLTPAGAIAGKATLGDKDTGNSGIRVTLDGTDLLTTTDDSGAFYLARVPIGTYRVRVEKSAFGGRTLRGIQVTFGQATQLDALSITQGITADFNNAPGFLTGQITRTPFQRAPNSALDPLPFDLAEDEVARWDTLQLSAEAEDVDGDPLTYFWSVTAGTLDRTDTQSVRWTVSDKAQTQATITVRVMDERSAAAYLSQAVSIVDAQAQSGVLLPGGRVLYAYRPFAGVWRVMHYDIASQFASRVGELESLDDPQVNMVGPYFHGTPFVNGDRRHMFWLAGDPPVERLPAGQGRGASAGGVLVRAEPPNVSAYDPSNNSSFLLYSCSPEACGDVEAASDGSVLSVARGGQVVAFSYDFGSQAVTRRQLTSPVGARLRTDGSSLVYADVPPGGGRSFANSIVRTVLASGSGTDLYNGAYDVLIGGYNGRFVSFTEQAFRVVYSPERAFLRDTHNSLTLPLDGATDVWAQDETFAIRDGRVLARRYPRADWLRDPDRTHYQLVILELPP